MHRSLGSPFTSMADPFCDYGVPPAPGTPWIRVFHQPAASFSGKGPFRHCTAAWLAAKASKVLVPARRLLDSSLGTEYGRAKFVCGLDASGVLAAVPHADVDLRPSTDEPAVAFA